MADGLLEGVLGGEEAGTDATKAGAEPVAAAIAGSLANQHPEVAAKAAAFFEKQTEVLEIQKRSLEAEYEFFETEWGPRLLALRLRVGFQLVMAVVAGTFGVGLAMLIYSAVHSHSVVIDAFEIAPNVAAEVPSGKIVASDLLDVLTRIQSATHSNAESRQLTNAWAREISIEVPETGISIGQLERTIETRFGHDQHIEGDLVKTATGLALTVRGNGILPKTFTDEAHNLDKLVMEAGEYVYGQSQPGLWATYLGSDNDRLDEAIRFAQTAYATVDPSERPYLLTAWANAIAAKGEHGAMSEALTLYREAVRLKPDYWVGYTNIMFALSVLGHEEDVLPVGERMMHGAGGRPGQAPDAMYQYYDQMVWDLPAVLGAIVADMESHGGVGTSVAASGTESLSAALLEVQLHDTDAAQLRLKTTRIDQNNVPDLALAAVDRAFLAEERGDLKTAAKEWDAFAEAYSDPTVSAASPQYICYSAVTYEKNGEPAKADAALNAVGALTFVDCYRFKGDVLDLRGDWSGASEWYAKAVRLAPSIPSGYYSWGVALAKHGDLDGAVSKLKVASLKGPHWADPLKAWGDVLLKQGKPKEALAKYDEALKYAPNWKELKDAREAMGTQKT